MSRAISAVLPLLTFACASAGAADREEVFRGYYAHGFEVESFRECGRDESWWVVRGDELNRRYRQLEVAPYQPAFAVVRGRVGPQGRYGHLGGYERELSVTEVLEVSRSAPGNCP